MFGSQDLQVGPQRLNVKHGVSRDLDQACSQFIDSAIRSTGCTGCSSVGLPAGEIKQDTSKRAGFNWLLLSNLCCQMTVVFAYL